MGKYVIVFLLILMGIVVFITFKLHSSVSNWEHYIKKEDAPELTFKQFYSLYIVMPERFVLNNFDVSYRYKDISFKTYFDYYKYQKFLKRHKQQKKKMKQIETQADLIKLLQRDLAAKQEENEEWVKKNIKSLFKN